MYLHYFAQVTTYNDINLLLFQIWILEASLQSGRWWTKAPDILPRAVAWTKKVPFEANVNFGELFPEVSCIHKILVFLIP